MEEVYIDDIFFTWKHGEGSLKQFIETLNACHSTIKSTAEWKSIKIFFPEIPMVGFRNGKSRRGYLQSTIVLPIGTCQVFNHIIITNTLQQKPVEKYLKFKVGSLTVTQKRFFTF